MAQDWITTAEAARITGYTDDYIRRLIRRGRITGQRFNRSWQVSRSSLLVYKRQAEKWGAKRGPKFAS